MFVFAQLLASMRNLLPAQALQYDLTAIKLR